METLIFMRDIHYRYTDSDWVLRGITTAFEKGQYCFICGGNGSGKSTLGYLFNGLIPHFWGGTLRGKVLVDGVDTQMTRVSEIFSQVGLVLQNSDAQLFNSTVEDEIAFGLENLGLTVQEIERRIEDIAQSLHISHLLRRSPMALSGGEKRLAAIASVLCLDPSVLLLDEPFAHLDWAGVRRVRQALAGIDRTNRSIVVIEQLLGSFLQDATRCLLMEQGRITLDAAPQTAEQTLRRSHLMPAYAPRRKSEALSDEPLLVVRNLIYSAAERTILKSVSVAVQKGESVAIIGRNGAGKTTLIKHFNGLLKPSHGEVFFKGENIRGKAPNELARQVGLSFQNPNDQFFRYRVRDELAVGIRLAQGNTQDWFEELCELFELKDLLDRSPYRLSEGEKKRVALASILAMKPELLILDEPTVGQDGHARERLAKLLSELQQRGFTTLIVTHDMDFAQATTDRWVVLHEGRVMADGSPQELRSRDDVARLGVLGACSVANG